MSQRLFEPLSFARGPGMKNRIALSPMTSDQALPDGRVTDDEVRWIRMRAQGGFGLIVTSAAYVQANGKGGAGQTAIHSDDHIDGLSRLAQQIQGQGRVAALQLHHAGARAWKRSVAKPVAPSKGSNADARELSTYEVEKLVEAFVGGYEKPN